MLQLSQGMISRKRRRLQEDETAPVNKMATSNDQSSCSVREFGPEELQELLESVSKVSGSLL